LAGETVEEKLKSFFAQENKDAELFKAFQKADALFISRCGDVDCPRNSLAAEGGSGTNHLLSAASLSVGFSRLTTHRL